MTLALTPNRRRPSRSPNPGRHLSALRLFVATALVALLGSVSLAVLAAPPEGADGAGGPGGHGMHGHRGLHNPHHVMRMLDAVNATPEQRAQIKQIMQAAKPEMAAQHEAGRKLHEQSQALLTQPNIDARAAETLRQQMLAQHDQASKRRLQLMLDMSRVLTPEQRKTLAERMNQQRSMMERHRSEREALQGAPKQ